MTIPDQPAEGFLRLRMPFAGFYCSTHDAAFDNALEIINTDDGGAEIDRLCTSNVDWAQVRLAYVQAFISKASDGLEIPMNYAGMHSPRFYNFETDVLYVDIPVENVRQLHAQIMKEHGQEFTAHIEERLRPVSGFLPYYSNDLADWGHLEDWEMAQVSTLLDFHAATLEFDEGDIANELFEVIHNSIWNAVIDDSLVRDYEESDTSPSM